MNPWLIALLVAVVLACVFAVSLCMAAARADRDDASRPREDRKAGL